jgi:hypothetical protein
MTSRLTTLTKWVAELHDTGLQECHCVKEFTHWWIHPLDYREKWHLNARGSTIQVVSLLLVRSLTLFIVVDLILSS